MGTEHEHNWRLPDGPYIVIDTYPEQKPYVCECGAFTHDPSTGEPCRTCAPEDHARRTDDLVLLRSGPFDGTYVVRPVNRTVRYRVDPPEKHAQKYVTYERGEDEAVYQFRSNDWTLPLEPREAPARATSSTPA